jgi:hypothetical protein
MVYIKTDEPISTIMPLRRALGTPLSPINKRAKQAKRKGKHRERKY